MSTNRSLQLVKFAVLAILTAGMGARLANAQEAEGKFSLPYEVRWGQTVLPPGNYTFTVNSRGLPNDCVRVRGEDLRARIIIPQGIDYNFSGKSALIVERQGKKGTVRALRLPDAGLVIYYPAPKAERQVLAQAPALIQRIPILMAQQ
jgi:hypothetical protein